MPNLLARYNADMIVSGAGSKTTESKERGHNTHFEDFDTTGFVYIVIDGDEMRVRFINADNEVEYDETVTKQ